MDGIGLILSDPKLSYLFFFCGTVYANVILWGIL